MNDLGKTAARYLFYGVADDGEHDTPMDLVDDLAQVFKWDLDVCASRPNVCERFYSIGRDGFRFPWNGLCWMNPPYGQVISQWIDRAQSMARKGTSSAVVCLLPSRTDTRWWQKFVPLASQVVFIRGRLKFGRDQYWGRIYNERLETNSGLKKVNTLMGKVGGRWCSPLAHRRVQDCFGHRGVYENWKEAEHIRPDSSPFPSAFVVFGEIGKRQRNKLASYGWSIKGVSMS